MHLLHLLSRRSVLYQAVLAKFPILLGVDSSFAIHFYVLALVHSEILRKLHHQVSAVPEPYTPVWILARICLGIGPFLSVTRDTLTRPTVILVTNFFGPRWFNK